MPGQVNPIFKYLFADTGSTDDVIDGGPERLERAVGSPTLAAAELGMSEDLTVMFIQDPVRRRRSRFETVPIKRAPVNDIDDQFTNSLNFNRATTSGTARGHQ